MIKNFTDDLMSCIDDAEQRAYQLEAQAPLQRKRGDDDLMLDHIPDVAECRQIKARFAKENYWPNVWHVNDHGNVDLLSIGYNGAKIVKSWV